MRSTAVALVIIVLIVVAWGFIGIIVKAAESLLSPTGQVAVRYALSFLSFLLLVISLKFYRPDLQGVNYLTRVSFLRFKRYAVPNIIVILLGALLGFGISIPAFFISVALCGVYVTYVIGISLTIITVSILRVITGEEFLTRYKITYLTLLTLMIITTLTLTQVNISGLWSTILFATTWGAYMWVISHINRGHGDTIEQIYTSCIDMSFATGVGLLSVMTTLNISFNKLMRDIVWSVANPILLTLVIIGLVFLCTVLPYIATCIILSQEPALVIHFSILQYLEVIQGLLFGIFYFRELSLTLQTVLYLVISLVSLIACMILRMKEIS